MTGIGDQGSGDSVPAWVGRYIGLPYERGARGPHAFDCYGLMAWVMREEFGIPVPLHHGRDFAGGDDLSAPLIRARMAETLARGLPEWEAMATPAPGCGVLLRMGGQSCHCGVMVTARYALHITCGIQASRVDRQDFRWRHRFVAFYHYAGPGA